MIAFLWSEFIGIFPIYMDYEKNKENVLKHIVPIWEITGTMIVFFVVELELIYSTLVPIASYLFIPIVGIFALLLILRNVFIIYAEFIWKKVDSKPLYMFYSAATVIMVIGFLTAVAALLTGLGIHLNLTTLSKSYINYLPLLGTDVYWIFLIGALFIAFGMSQVFYRTVKNTSFMPLITIAVGLIMDAYAYMSIASLDKASAGAYIILPFILTLAIPLLYMYKPTTHLASYKPFWFIMITIAVFSLELPVTKIAGGAFPINAFASVNSMQAANFYLSIIGGIIYILLMVMYAYVYNSGWLSFKPEEGHKKGNTSKEDAKITKN